jgi:hypothetical protein
MARHTTPTSFADDLRQRGARDVKVDDSPERSAFIEVHARGSVSIKAVFDRETLRFRWAVRTDVDPSLAPTISTMKAIIHALGLRPDKEWKVGSANGGKMRELKTSDDVRAEVDRLHAEGQPVIVRRWDEKQNAFLLHEQPPVPAASKPEPEFRSHVGAAGVRALAAHLGGPQPAKPVRVIFDLPTARDTAWNPTSTKSSPASDLVGPATVEYAFYADGGIDTRVHDLGAVPATAPLPR